MCRCALRQPPHAHKCSLICSKPAHTAGSAFPHRSPESGQTASGHLRPKGWARRNVLVGREAVLRLVQPPLRLGAEGCSSEALAAFPKPDINRAARSVRTGWIADLEVRPASGPLRAHSGHSRRSTRSPIADVCSCRRSDRCSLVGPKPTSTIAPARSDCGRLHRCETAERRGEAPISEVCSGPEADLLVCASFVVQMI
jgi:hypothetical protein